MAGGSGDGGLVQAVDQVDWAAYAMAPSQRWYQPEDVPAAFRLLLGVTSQAQGWAAYDRMLFAVGNNHAGLLYPAAVPAVPLLVRVAPSRRGWVRWAALEILTEFLALGPDRAEFVDPAGSTVRARDAILAAVGDLSADLDAFAHAADAFAHAADDVAHAADDVAVAGTARELLAAIDEDRATRPR